jgi:cytochrome c oxidase cbb3-type subunit 3
VATRPVLRIFISSTAIDLTGYRDKVRDAVLRLEGLPIAMETFCASGGVPATEYMRMAAEADAVVCIVAHRYGYVPPVELGGDGERSITWLEVDAAKRAGKPVFAFVVDPKTPWTEVKEQDRLVSEPEKAAEIVRAVQKLQEFKTYLGRETTRRTFASQEQLAEHVTATLANFAPRASATARVWKALFRIMNISRMFRCGSGKQEMLARFVVAGAGLLLAASLGAWQADHVAGAEKEKNAGQKVPAQKEKPGPDLAALMGGPRLDPAAVERGREIFVPSCGFCHGNDAHGKSGPDLVRSALVLHDSKGDMIIPVIHDGRPDRGMPAFAALSAEQIADISTFLHSRAADVANRFAYKIGDLITGDPRKGAVFFQGEGHCAQCHSPSGDLAHVATKYEPVELQRRMLYPAPNMIDLFLGRSVKPPAPTKVTVHLPSGQEVSGTLDHQDEFTIGMHDSSGWYQSFARENVKVEIQDPRAAHEALLPKYTDDDMHNMLAYLETLK